MRRIAFSSGSERKFHRFGERHPELRQRVGEIVLILQKNPLDQSVRVHKLSGRLEQCYGADVTFQYRIVYRFDGEFLYLLNIGTHDEVY